MLRRVCVLCCLLVAGGLDAALAQRVLGVRPTESGGPLMPEQAAYDVTFYELDLAVDPGARAIDGTLTTHARIVQPVEWFVQHLDSFLTVRRVELLRADGAVPLPFEQRDGQLWSHLIPSRQPGDEVVVRVTYGGQPREAPRPPWVGGFTWAETADGSPWIATSVQGDGADLWWPCKDHPSDEPDSMALHFTVPTPLVAASNGRLRGVDDHGDGTRTYRWFVSTPINNYGVALNVAPYRTIEGTYRSITGEEIPVTYWVLPENYEKGVALFPQFAEHLAFYEEYLGPYPFRADKYGVAETPHLGMEHQTIIAYGNAYRNNAFGYDGLHHHELGHEWWGNLVTALDWRDFWLHEGFCSYMQPLYAEYLHGEAAYHEAMAGSRPNIRNRQTVAPRASRTEGQMYLLAPDYVESDGDIYNKGKWILHTLRYLIGDEAFFLALRLMAYPDPALERITDGRQVRFATTDDFLRIAEAAAGRELDWFFEVYLRQPELPRLVTRRTPDGLTLAWETPGDLPFPMPIDVQIGEEVRRLDLADGPVTLPLTETAPAPIIDPDRWVLKDEAE